MKLLTDDENDKILLATLITGTIFLIFLLLYTFLFESFNWSHIFLFPIIAIFGFPELYLVFCLFYLIQSKIILPISEWFMVEFLSITTRKGKEQTRLLRKAKKREKVEAQKIHEALKMEQKSIPKLPSKLDTNQITKDINYLKTLDNKSYLVKYAGDFRDRFIARGQTKTYKEIEKLVSAKTAVETALSSLAFAQEDRYTSQERAQAEYLLKTLKAQDDIRQHHGNVREREELASTELETKKTELEARLLKAKLEAKQAKKAMADLQAPPEKSRQKKTEIEKLEEKLKNQTYPQKLMMISQKMEEDKKRTEETAQREGWPPEKLERHLELIEANYQKFIQNLR